MNKDEEDPIDRVLSSEENLVEWFKKSGFGKTPDILPPQWHLYCFIKCPSCQSDMHWISTEHETDMLYRHVWCPNLECIQNKRLYTILVTPQSCEVVGSEPR